MEEKELLVLANCLLSGLLFGLLFDVFRIVRRSFDEKGRFVNFFDGLFWIVYAVLFIRRLFIINGGDLRWFVFAGTFFGILLYFFLLSRIFMPVGIFLMKVVKKCIEKGVLCLTAKNKVRLLPALNISDELLHEAISVIKEICAE